MAQTPEGRASVVWPAEGRLDPAKTWLVPEHTLMSGLYTPYEFGGYKDWSVNGSKVAWISQSIAWADHLAIAALRMRLEATSARLHRMLIDAFRGLPEEDFVVLQTPTFSWMSESSRDHIDSDRSCSVWTCWLFPRPMPYAMRMMMMAVPLLLQRTSFRRP